MNHAQRLAALAEHGWTNPQNGYVHTIGKKDPIRCVWIVGPLWGKDRDAWLDVESGLVMVWDGGDYDLKQFIQELQSPREVAQVASGPKQGSLFE